MQKIFCGSSQALIGIPKLVMKSTVRQGPDLAVLSCGMVKSGRGQIVFSIMDLLKI